MAKKFFMALKKKKYPRFENIPLMHKQLLSNSIKSLNIWIIITLLVVLAVMKPGSSEILLAQGLQQGCRAEYCICCLAILGVLFIHCVLTSSLKVRGMTEWGQWGIYKFCQTQFSIFKGFSSTLLKKCCPRILH